MSLFHRILLTAAMTLHAGLRAHSSPVNGIGGQPWKFFRGKRVDQEQTHYRNDKDDEAQFALHVSIVSQLFSGRSCHTLGIKFP
jgi:hypothetical protein